MGAGGKLVSGNAKADATALSRLSAKAAKSWFGAKTPAIYFVAYIGIVLSFSIEYQRLGPGNFYDSAVIHENIFPEERSEFNRFLAELVEKGASASLTTPDPRLVIISHIYPYQIRSTELKDGVLSGYMTYVLTDYPKPGDRFFCDFDFSVDTTHIWESNYDTGSSALHHYIMMWPTSRKYADVGKVGVCDTNRDLLSMFPEGETKFGFGYNVSSEKPAYIPLNGADEKRMFDFALAFKGDPYFLRHDRMRMFYFSATTITTVGFGDIVPISEAARLLTGIEAILGWIVAGLFINAVTRGRGRQ